MKRRSFLKWVTFSAATSSFFGCSTLDQILFAESADLRKKVVIIGAGLSGLLCAYHLKKNGVPFVIFEKNQTPGGVLVSYRGGFGTPFWVELSPSLGIFYPTSEVTKILDDLGISHRSIKTSEFQWTKGMFAGGKKREFFSQLIWGYPSHDLREETAEILKSKVIEMVVLEGGLQTLVDRLSDMIFGGFPERSLRVRHEWIGVEGYLDSWDLIFATPNGRRRFEARWVILALPLSYLRWVSGAERWVHPPEDNAPGRIRGVAVRQLSEKKGRGASSEFFGISLDPLRLEWTHQKKGVWGETLSQARFEYWYSSLPVLKPEPSEAWVYRRSWVSADLDRLPQVPVKNQFLWGWSGPTSWLATQDWRAGNSHPIMSPIQATFERCRQLVQELLTSAESDLNIMGSDRRSRI